MSTKWAILNTMSEYREINSRDTDAYSEIVEVAGQILAEIAVCDPEYNTDNSLANALETGRLGTSPFCAEASDAATRAAHFLGIAASREFIGGYHFITSLA